MVKEESHRLCGAFHYKATVRYQSGLSFEKPKYRLPAPGSLNVPHSPDWEESASVPANKAFLDAVVKAVQVYPVLIEKFPPRLTY